MTPSRDWSAYRQQLQSHGGDRDRRDSDSYGGAGAGGYGGRGNNEGHQDPYGTQSQDRGGYGRGRYNNNEGRYNNEGGRYNNNDRFNNHEEGGEKESVMVPQNAVGFIIGRRMNFLIFSLILIRRWNE